MRTAKVNFRTVEDISHFVNVVNCYDYNVDIQAGSYQVDGKSILGVMSIGTNKVLEMVVHEEKCQDMLERLAFCIA